MTEVKSMQKKGLLALLFILLLPGLVYAADRRVRKSRLVIMTLNAEFLWDGQSPEEGQVDFAWKGDRQAAEAHMREISEVIRDHNPDVVNLVEVENLDALKTLNRKFLKGMRYRAYLVNGTDSFTGQDVGLLTRIDPDEMDRYREKGESGSTQKSVSKNYFAKLTVNGAKIALVGLHFLARPSDESRKEQREAQADAMRDLAVSLAAEGYAVVMLGDYNDYDGNPCCRDHISSTPITEVLAWAKEMDPDTLLDDLVNAAQYAAQDGRYTAFWDKDGGNDVDFPEELTSIDHVLLSPALAVKVRSVEFPHDYDPREVTDHFPVVVHLQLEGRR